jgi:hypothetical protein
MRCTKGDAFGAIGFKALDMSPRILRKTFPQLVPRLEGRPG